VKLLSLLNTEVLGELNGIVSTGKEANVYHALAGEQSPAPTTGTHFLQLLVFSKTEQVVNED
jgi:RIO kinase 1